MIAMSNEVGVAEPLASPGQLDQLCVNTIRTLSMDAVQRTNSGHPGTPMAMAPVAYCVWQRILGFDPADPIWPNRDGDLLDIDLPAHFGAAVARSLIA